MANEHLETRQTPIRAGERAPDFTLLDHNRNEWTLSEHLKKGEVVLCFYPMDFSPVCSTEMKCITEDLQKYEAAGAEAVGVSCDSFFTHAAWRKAEGLKQPLLADMHRQVCKAYGFYFPDLNVAARGTVVIGTDGKVKWVQARQIKDAMDPGEVLGAIS